MMPEFHIPFDVFFQGETLQISDRILGAWGNPDAEHVAIIVGGIHGNETAGIFAIERLFKGLRDAPHNKSFWVLGILGNMEACKLAQRFIYRDMNRIWTRSAVDDMHYGKLDMRHSELREMTELYDLLKPFLLLRKEVTLIDLHTTSAPTTPFAVAPTSSSALDLLQSFPFPVVTGLSGFLDGTLLEYVCQLGHSGFAFEGGQHYEHAAVNKQEAFLWLCLHELKAYILNEREFDFYGRMFRSDTENMHQGVFKIVSRYKIDEDEQFEMLDGFENFTPVFKDQCLAISNGREVRSPYNGLMFMPLYQQQGQDGFFIIMPLDLIDI